MSERKQLQCEWVLSIMENLMYEYGKPNFQTKLHAMYYDSCNPTANKEIYEELSAIRFKTIEPFGFAPCAKGWRNFGHDFAQCAFDPDVRRTSDQLDILTSPKLQAQFNSDEYVDTHRLSPHLIETHKNLQEKLAKFRERYAKDIGLSGESEFGRLWKVVGGKSNSGIVVRTDQNLQSAALITRLESGAQVRELNKIGERLHFEKISGKGPKYGWVSIMLKNTKLLQLQNIQKMLETDEIKLVEEANEVKLVEEANKVKLEEEAHEVKLEEEANEVKLEEEANEVKLEEEIRIPEKENPSISKLRNRFATDMTEASTCVPSTPMHEIDLEEDQSDWTGICSNDFKM